MNASDLVDFLLEDDDIPLAVRYEVPQLPWETIDSAGLERSGGRRVKGKKCSSLTLEEMDELLQDLEQLITRPSKDQNVEISVENSDWGRDSPRDSSNENRAKKDRGKQKKIRSKKDRAQMDEEPHMSPNQLKKKRQSNKATNEDPAKEKKTIGDSDRSKKIPKKQKNSRKIPDFDPRGEEADPSEIKSIIRAQQIKTNVNDNDFSHHASSRHQFHHGEDFNEEHGKDSKRARPKKSKNRVENGQETSVKGTSILEIQEQDKKEARSRKGRKKEVKKESKKEHTQDTKEEQEKEGNDAVDMPSKPQRKRINVRPKKFSRLANKAERPEAADETIS